MLNSNVNIQNVSSQFTAAKNVSILSINAYKMGRLVIIDLSFMVSVVNLDTAIMTPNNDGVRPQAAVYSCFSTGHDSAHKNITCYVSYWQGTFIIGNGAGDPNVNYRVHISYFSVS